MTYDHNQKMLYFHLWIFHVLTHIPNVNGQVWKKDESRQHEIQSVEQMYYQVDTKSPTRFLIQFNCI